MKKKFLNTLAAALLTGAVAVSGLTACSSSDDNIAEETPVVNPAQPQTYRVSIPATIGGEAETRAVSFDGTESTSTFTTSERVYVYNKTKNAMLDGYLSPANLSADGQSCDLNGTLTGTIEANDQLVLLYNLSRFSTEVLGSNQFDYQYQNGASVLDGAKAEVVVSEYSGGVLTTTATASFTNVQSMFRLKFTDGSSDISVKRLTIKSANYAVASYLRPLNAVGDQYYSNFSGNVVSPASATSDYLYVALCFNESLSNGDILTFTVIDNANHVYEGTKAAPDGGFKNGKYYYNASAITLTQQPDLVKPTVTGTSITPNAYNSYYVDDAQNITISGTSNGYRFSMRLDNSNVTLSNLDAIYSASNDEYISFASSSTTSTVTVNGANSICNPTWSHCISADGGNSDLKLTGNGTLTVTSKRHERCGLLGRNYNFTNNDYLTTSEIDVSAQLALDPTKTTVIRSARHQGESLYTWTYTVTTTE